MSSVLNSFCRHWFLSISRCKMAKVSYLLVMIHCTHPSPQVSSPHCRPKDCPAVWC